jgi:MFS family permease
MAQSDKPPSSGPVELIDAHTPYRWYRELNGYHWFVMIVAALGWLFDCLDQQLFVLARPAAMRDLLRGMLTSSDLQKHDFDTWVRVYSGYATSIFLLGWGAGGLVFGVMGDRIGRAKTMLITILMYSLFTGLSAISRSFWDFAAYRFLTGLGVGGEFAVGVALVAEVMPDRARPYCLTLLQMLSALGNMIAAGINMSMGVLEEEGLVTSPWRKMFLIGAAPALLAVVIRLRLKEPDKWVQKSHDDAVTRQLGSYRELFRHPVWRRHAIIGLMLAFSGVVGLWAVGFFAPDLTGQIMKREITARVLREQTAAAEQAGDTQRVAQLQQLRDVLQTKDAKPPPELGDIAAQVNKAVSGRQAYWGGVTSMLIQIGAFFGMFGFGAVAQRIGRKPTFALGMVAAFASTVWVFWFLEDFSQLVWMMPIMGFCQLSLFAGYAVYFPELFPTHLRSTGTSFCYNVGRFVAATGPLIQSELNKVFAQTPDPLRYAGVSMCVVFLFGLLVLPFAPETRGKPLPE